MNVRRALEKNGFMVQKFDDCWLISQFTPAGEDWSYEVETLGEMVKIAEGFDPEEEFEMWIEAKRGGTAGVPKIPELWQDQLWKQETLNKVLEDIG